MTHSRTKVSDLAKAIAARTKNAHSSNRFVSWAALTQYLLDRGYNEVEVETILRSKWTRWGADWSPRSSGLASVADFDSWIKRSFDSRVHEAREVFKMVQDTVR